MAKMGDTGIGTGGNFVKPDDLFTSGKVFVITNAAFREAHGEFDEQINLTIQYDEPDANGNIEATLSLPLNDVRRKFLDWFRNGGESINGVEQENGLILSKGKIANKGNKPYIFIDAPLDGSGKIPAETSGASGNGVDFAKHLKNKVSDADDIPF